MIFLKRRGARIINHVTRGVMYSLGDDDDEFKTLKSFVAVLNAHRAAMSRGDMLGFKDLDELVDACKADNRCPYEVAADTQWFREPENLDDNISKAIRLLHDARVAAFPSGRALCLAVGHGYIKTARTLIDLGICDPLTARDKEQNNGTILHSAAHSDTEIFIEKVYQLAPSLIHARDDEGDTPLDVAIMSPDCQTARFLLERGAHLNQIRPSSGHSMLESVLENSSVNSFLRDRGYGHVDMVKLVFAYGARLPLYDWYHEPDQYDDYIKTLFARFRRCARAAVAMLGLNHVGCKTQGNGRDALQLIARMIWVYRVDEVWGDYDEKDDDELQERLANVPSEEDDDEEASDQVDGGESPQKRAAIE